MGKASCRISQYANAVAVAAGVLTLGAVVTSCIAASAMAATLQTVRATTTKILQKKDTVQDPDTTDMAENKTVALS